jgi:hypothetical protein
MFTIFDFLVLFPLAGLLDAIHDSFLMTFCLSQIEANSFGSNLTIII